ncbi:uncharacterized protein N7479_010005 [Penicillium vulpinum]|uniref:Uncharacterized protein n=1 Tax=Penicillium vulpinum TaxID=29845 RepID=A0A1V6REP2_9EURO|nr:uncharacterized protein N7479_010005 [Penicillium vulpinum]KAJ5951592.1 hypothetical protein N7479_010005 [Penicillium vulpinum]OQE00020.1 hypothetical protein PENVUL_c060G03734 [Penicillium vulpinum]
MKFTIAAIIPLLAVAISASPLEARQAKDVTVALSNDVSGAYAGATFPADNTDKSIFSLYGSTSVGAGGTVRATSAQLTNWASAGQSINCVIKNNGAIIGTLNAQQTFVNLDGGVIPRVPVNLNNAQIRCRV